MVATLCCCSMTTGQEHKQPPKAENRQEASDVEQAGGNQAPAEAVERLNEPMIPKRKWKMAGQATPQKTLETFMWAIRDQNEERFRACLSVPDEVELPTIEDFEKLSDAVYAIQSLALRNVGKPGNVDLKFRWAILGEGKTVLTHRFKLVDKAWKIDMSANTYDADW